MVLSHQAFRYDFHDIALSRRLQESWHLSNERVLEAHVLRGHRDHRLEALLDEWRKLRVPTELLDDISEQHN